MCFERINYPVAAAPIRSGQNKNVLAPNLMSGADLAFTSAYKVKSCGSGAAGPRFPPRRGGRYSLWGKGRLMVRRLMPEVVHGQQLAELPGTATVREAARLMAARNVGSVLVTAGDGRLEGILTERDVVYRVVVPGRDPDHTPLHEVMTEDPDTIGPSESAIEALRRMRGGGYRHLPVVGAGGRLMGVVSHRDFLGEETTRLEDETRLWEIMG